MYQDLKYLNEECSAEGGVELVGGVESRCRIRDRVTTHRAPDRTGDFSRGGAPDRLKILVKGTELSDVYSSIWEFAQDMYYKQPKKDDDGYHFGTVNVLYPQSWKRLSEIERCYAAARQ